MSSSPAYTTDFSGAAATEAAEAIASNELDKAGTYGTYEESDTKTTPPTSPPAAVAMIVAVSSPLLIASTLSSFNTSLAFSGLA